MEKTKDILLFTFLSFSFLFILSVPFEYAVLPDIGKYLHPIFEILVNLTGRYLFNIQGEFISDIVSDSLGMYIHVFNLLILSLIVGIAAALVFKKRFNRTAIYQWGITIISYYLSLQFFIYGFNKIFKAQFYLPEPNTLYTPLGYLSNDILYWSTMGSSYSYSLIMGLLEIIPAVLLLFKRTRQAGAIGALLMMINIVAINFSYDISVKIFSSFLLINSLFVAWPGISAVFKVLVLKQNVVNVDAASPTKNVKQKKIIGVIKGVVVLLILVESLFIYITTGNFNDDNASRPLLHGAYIVELDSSNYLFEPGHTIKRIFIHRKAYFIVQNEQNELSDYPFTYSANAINIKLDGKNEVKLNYILTKDSVLKLSGWFMQKPVVINAKQINLSQLPLFKKQFHWTIDEYMKEE